MTAEHYAKMIAALVFLASWTSSAHERTNPAAATISFATRAIETVFHFERLDITPPAPPAVVPVKLTAYHSQNCIVNPRRGLTATGSSACNADGIAADWQILPPGTRLQIPGVGCRTVDDTGEEMQRAGRHGVIHLDVRFRSYKEACRFGMRWTLAKLL